LGNRSFVPLPCHRPQISPISATRSWH